MRRSAEFATTVRRGRRGTARALTVHVEPALVPAETQSAPLVGFVVSRAVGGAVVRNRVRRRLRHLLRERLGTLPAGTRVVIRANPAAATRTSAQLAADLDRALVRAAGQQVGAR